jgi:hypothetical protein
MIAAALLLALSGAAAPPCTPIAGAAPLLAMADRRAFIFGELHGTNEIPALFADLVCEAAAQGSVIVGLEMPESSQAALDAWVGSDGGAAALATLLRDGHWRFADGRASQAMLALVERLRALKAAGRPVSLLAFVPASAATLTGTAYEQAMAAIWRRALTGTPGARLLVLVGNIHSRTAPYRGFEPAAMHVPRAQSLTFGPFPVGGSVNNCSAQDCGLHAVGPALEPMPPRGVIPTPPQAQATMPYDYLYSPGEALTGSPALTAGSRSTRAP